MMKQPQIRDIVSEFTVTDVLALKGLEVGHSRGRSSYNIPNPFYPYDPSSDSFNIKDDRIWTSYKDIPPAAQAVLDIVNPGCTVPGGGVLDLVCCLEGLRSHAEAAEWLRERKPGLGREKDGESPRGNSHSSSASRESGILIMNRPSLDFTPALLDYASSRGFSKKLLSLYCWRVDAAFKARPDLVHSYIGWSNIQGGLELRNGEERFSKVSVSPKAFSFLSTVGHDWSVRRQGDKCLVFEGWPDFLSYMTLNGATVLPEGTDSFVLNSVVTLPKAKGYISSYPLVECWTDLDTAGRRASESVKEIACKAGHVFVDGMSEFITKRFGGSVPQGAKDLNDLLKKIMAEPKARIKYHP